MKYLSASAILFLLSIQLCNAQCSITGKIIDTVNNTGLPQASVVLLRASDSVMEHFTRAKTDGSFELHTAKEGKYILMITFPNFADYIDVVTVKDAKTVALGDISMVSRTHLLTEFVLTQQIAAIKIKGDTTEYMADSFKVKDNATVEDLLKKLPGLEVDKNGKVTAQGQEVKKILVDGEEFFSDDPAVVTKNLQSSVVEKVQVYDKKSDQAEFTGIDDGEKTKTINLQLKEDKKKGYFGKIDAGGGTDGYYQNQGMINNFKGKQQISIFGIASNTDQVGLGWADNEKYSSTNMTTEITDGGDVATYYTDNNDDFQSWNGTYNGQGLPTVLTGGVHYADKWNEDQQHLTGNYRYADQDVNISTNNTTENILPGNMQNITQQTGSQSSKGQRHSIDAMYEWKIDTTSSIKLTANAGYKSTSTSSLYNTNVYDDNSLTGIDSLINTTNRRVTSTSTSQDINSDLLYRKKFNKKGRTLSIDVKENYKEAQSNGYLYSNSIYAGGYDSLIDQRKQNTSNTLAFSGKAVYTEPLSKVAFLELHYSVTVNNSTSASYSYDKSAGSELYNVLDTLYSSNYKFNILTNAGGVNLHYVFKKINFSFGSDISDARYNQVSMLGPDTTYNRNYFNLFPKASFVYNFGKQTSLHINYQGSTTQPTINQIAPLRQNIDPLNIEIGDPALKQQFQNKISASFNDYKVLTSRYVWAGGAINFISNAIGQSQNTDPVTGINTLQYVNVNGDYNGYGYAGYHFKLQKLNLGIGINANANFNHSESYVNEIENVSNDNTYSLEMNFDYDKEKKYSFSFRPSVAYNDNRSSISTYNASYWSSDNTLEGTYNLPLKFEIGTTVNWVLHQQTIVFDQNNDILKWNAYLSKKFLKGDKLELRATAYDILNQNIGFTRTAQNNIITQNEYNTIRRHGIISLIWNFSKAPGITSNNK